jgi:hypothetical protein
MTRQDGKRSGATRIVDLTGVEVEHGYGLATGKGFVKVRVLTDAKNPGLVVLGQARPADAVQIARDLIVAAARAEYEQDLAEGLRSIGFDDQTVGKILGLVRFAEERRETGR